MIGALPLTGNRTRFRLWGPKLEKVEVSIEKTSLERFIPLTKDKNGFFEGTVSDVSAGDRYRYRINGDVHFPDPASRYQPEGVHGPSEIVDLSTFPWTDQKWKGRTADQLSIYELHAGTFTPEGTFRGIEKKLSYLKGLGITAIEIMPVADFPGRWNWGYDGVAVFSPARCYGSPRDLQRLVNAAHRTGLAVILDVVYNHLGPDGNYLGCYSDAYNSKRHKTGWGDGFNFDGPGSDAVREFFIENALQWLTEYHFDGLRLDATHAIIDDSKRHFLSELSERCRKAVPKRNIVLIAEDHRRQTIFTDSIRKKGWGLDAVWSDDFHHQVRRRTAGDHEAYFKPFTGSTKHIVETLKTGWWSAKPTPSTKNMAPSRFVICIQNHDQIGNRAFGERLHHQIDPAQYRAVTTLMLLSPYIPLLFMGQEWAASAPFLFFTDHNEQLGKLVIKGRRDEFKDFSHFRDPSVRKKIPSPQQESTFLKSKLNWTEMNEFKHLKVLNLYRELLRLRHREPALGVVDRHSFKATQLSPSIILLRREYAGDNAIEAVINLERSAHAMLPAMKRRIILSTEDSAVASDPKPIVLDTRGTSHEIVFERPGALIYRLTRSKQAKGK